MPSCELTTAATGYAQTQTRYRIMKRKQSPHHMNIASILQHLPFHRQISESQSLILKLTPIWHDWCEQQRGKKGLKHFSAAQDTTLSAFENGVLTLACLSTTSATTIKHQKNDLLNHFQKAGFDAIRRIHVRMELKPPNMVSPTTNNPKVVTEERVAKRAQPSTSSIKSVEAVKRRVENEHLASSLERLANTLKNHK